MGRILDLIVPAAQAHEKWFISSADVAAAPNPFLAFRPATVIGLLAIAAAVLVGRYYDRKFEASGLHKRMEDKVRPLRDLAAIVMAAFTGFNLIWLSAHGAYLADNYAVEALGGIGPFLMLVQALTGSLMIIGLYTHVTSASLMLMYLSLFAFFGLREPLDYLHYAGIGIFLYYFSRNRYSLDWFLGKPIFTTPEVRKLAYVVMRVCTGVAVLVLSTLKFLRPELHIALIDEHASFNPYQLLQEVGFSSLSREAYVFLLFLIECVSGFFILFGWLTRIVAIVLIPMFLIGAIFLGFGEIMGHLPIVGVLFALFLFGDTYTKSPGKSKKVV